MENIDAAKLSANPPASGRVAGIVVALPEELATLTPCKLKQGEIFTLRNNVLIVYSGTGPANANRAADLLIERGVDCLISWGCAAALSTHLNPGDLVLPERVMSEQQLTLSTDDQWLRHIQQLLSKKIPLTAGLLVESSRIIAGSKEKLTLHDQTKADALDMESFAIINTANKAGLPAVAIRAIADPVTMSLPQAIMHSLNEDGQIELNKLLRFLLRHPWELPTLLKLGLHFHAAGNTLKKVEKLLNEIVNFKSQADLQNR